MATNSARPSAGQAALEQFAEKIAAAGPCPGAVTQRGDFYYVHCPFPGPEDDPHQAKGEPQVYLWHRQGEVYAHCNKCIGDKNQLTRDDSTRAAASTWGGSKSWSTGRPFPRRPDTRPRPSGSTAISIATSGT